MKKAKVLGAILAGVMAVSGVSAVPGLPGALSITASAASKLAAPQNFKAQVSGTSIKLTWSKVDGAYGYRVYKYNSTTKKYEKYKNTTSTSLTIKKLAAGTYKFKVAALVKKSGGYAVQTASSAVSAKISSSSSSGSTSAASGSIDVGIFKLPAFGTSAKEAAKALGMTDYEYVQQDTDYGVKVGGCVGTAKINGAEWTVSVLENDKGQYFAVLLVGDTDAGTFANAYKKVSGKLGKPDETIDMFGISMYAWGTPESPVIYTLMGADAEGNSATMFMAISTKYAPPEMLSQGAGGFDLGGGISI